MQYNPQDWYWVVGGDTAQVYSSAAEDFVPTDNAAYLAWIAQGGVATKIGSAAELGEVLAEYSLRPAALAVLDGYQDAQATKLTVETVAKICFNHENRLRAVEGKQPINASQFKQALKDLM
jgi:hypothetical protein